jgi:hypothetical protein
MTERAALGAEGQNHRVQHRVLHVVVGHGLRTYFLNTVRSVRMSAPGDQILVVDNASPDNHLRKDLARIATSDPKMKLLLRDSNNLMNGKVGGLYDAYREAFDIAIQEGFDYVHLVQADMQVLWWDDSVLSRASDIFRTNPRCVNIYTCLLPRDRAFDGGLTLEPGVTTKFRNFGLTDLGLYDLGRWQDLGVHFDNDEIEHGARYLSEGFSVLCHPWPTDAQIPWPAVIRNGSQHGREVTLTKPFLLKPLTKADVTELKTRNVTWLEDVCIPWGWTCLTPMWTTDVNADYVANRRHEIIRRGLLKGLPRWERRGLDDNSLRRAIVSQHRPSLWQLFIVVPAREIAKRLKLKQRVNSND